MSVRAPKLWPEHALLRAGLALLCLSPSSARAGELAGDLRLSVTAGVDTNARRDFDQVDVGIAPDMVTGLLAASRGRYQTERAQVLGTYDVGLRKFMRVPQEDVFIQAATLEGSHALGKFLGVGLGGRAKDRRGGDRDYTDLVGYGFVELVPDARVSLRVQGGAHRFLYLPDLPYSFGAGEVGLTGRYRFDRRHSLLAFGDAGFRRYQAPARLTEPPASGEVPRRQDSVITAGVGYAYRGPFALGATYSYSEQASNSVGASSFRHRLSLSGGVRLPWSVLLFAQLTLQLSRYPVDFPSQELIILDDDENHNAASLKLVRPISKHIDVEVRWALYQNQLPQKSLTYLRQVGWVGLGWRL